MCHKKRYKKVKLLRATGIYSRNTTLNSIVRSTGRDNGASHFAGTATLSRHEDALSQRKAAREQQLQEQRQKVNEASSEGPSGSEVNLTPTQAVDSAGCQLFKAEDATPLSIQEWEHALQEDIPTILQSVTYGNGAQLESSEVVRWQQMLAERFAQTANSAKFAIPAARFGPSGC